MRQTIMLCESYGDLQPNREYTVIAEGYDWYKLLFRGHLLYIPKHFEWKP